MCSLSYIPQAEGYILSHNRDELPNRESSSRIIDEDGLRGTFHFPQDLKAGGSWMGAHESGWSACLLNGGSVHYLRKLPYRHSRGKVLIDFLEDPSIDAFQKIDYQGVEPFTLILSKPGELWQLEHNPDGDIWNHLDPLKPHFWSSTKLYHPNIREARKYRFEQWLHQQKQAKASDLRQFHLDPQRSPREGGLLLGPNFPLKTVSFCQVNHQASEIQFQYDYLLKEVSDHRNWSIR